MRMTLEGELRIRLEMAGEGFEITSEEVSISPYRLLAGSLASCIALLVVPGRNDRGSLLNPPRSPSAGSTPRTWTIG